jgi:hypothetical protein
MAVRAAPIAMSAKASAALSSVKSITAPVRSSKTAMLRRNRSRDPVNVDCLLPAFDATAYLTAATSGPAPIEPSVETGRPSALPAEQPRNDPPEQLVRRALAVVERARHRRLLCLSRPGDKCLAGTVPSRGREATGPPRWHYEVGEDEPPRELSVGEREVLARVLPAAVQAKPASSADLCPVSLAALRAAGRAASSRAISRVRASASSADLVERGRHHQNGS